MFKRRSLSRGKSRRMFSRHAGVHPRNTMSSNPMRGGIRL